jgi:hypothetical protein
VADRHAAHVLPFVLDGITDCPKKEKIMNETWGLCKDCKWWQIEPDAKVKDQTLGMCIDEDLQEFRLLVSGNSGCNRFMEGTPARAKGSGSQPPIAEPVR